MRTPRAAACAAASARASSRSRRAKTACSPAVRSHARSVRRTRIARVAPADQSRSWLADTSRGVERAQAAGGRRAQRGGVAGADVVARAALRAFSPVKQQHRGRDRAGTAGDRAPLDARALCQLVAEIDCGLGPAVL